MTSGQGVGRQRAIRLLGATLTAAGVVAAALSGATSAAAEAGAAVQAASELPSDPRAAKAYRVLETHCARCHQAPMLQGQPEPAGQLGDILDLSRIATDPDLIIPGNADASRLYTLMLAREMPSDVAKGPSKVDAPTADEIESVRDWIEALSAGAPGCTTVRRVMPSDQVNALRDALARSPGADLRFITLAPLYGSCSDDRRMAGYREAAGRLLSVLSRKSEPLHLGRVDATGTMLAVRLADLGWTAQEWQQLAAAAPASVASAATMPADITQALGSDRPILTADWLAAAATTTSLVQDLLHLPTPPPEALRRLDASPDDLLKAGAKPGVKIDGLEPVAALAKAYTRPVTVQRAAADLGLEPQILAKRLTTVGGEEQLSAQRLLQSTLRRADAERLYASLAAAASGNGARVVAPATSPPLDLTLLADKLVYKAGDLVHFTARATGDCNLTLININAAGKATVLFPNDFEQDNALKAGTAIDIPGENVPYQLRFAQPGAERVIGICTTQSRMAEGIRQDYERQRFTALGDWRSFLAGILETEDADAGGADKPEAKPEPKRRSRSRSSEPKAVEPARRTLRETQARATISIRIE